MRITPDAAKGLAIAYGSYLEALVYRKSEEAIRYWGKQLALYQQRTGVVMLKLDAEYQSETPIHTVEPNPEDWSPHPEPKLSKKDMAAELQALAWEGAQV